MSLVTDYWPSNVHICGFWFLPKEWQFSCAECGEISALFASGHLKGKDELCAIHADRSKFSFFFFFSKYSQISLWVVWWTCKWYELIGKTNCRLFSDMELRWYRDRKPHYVGYHYICFHFLVNISADHFFFFCWVEKSWEKYNFTWCDFQVL